jgi:hypothetical protein
MEHAVHLPNPRRSLAIPLAAALLGAGVATATYAVTDSNEASPSKVVFVEPSGGDSQAATPQTSGARP